MQSQNCLQGGRIVPHLRTCVTLELGAAMAGIP